MCRGRLLDVGAGAGRHSLALQEQGFSVCAVEVVPQCVEIMKRRGIKEVHCADVLTFQAEPFDTVLCIMNGVTLAGSLAGLEPFLIHLLGLTKPDGQLLIDSTDLRELPELSDVVKSKTAAGEYFGEMRVQIEYKGVRGEPFNELYIHPELLAEISARAGWTCKVIFKELGIRYLAQLAPQS